MAQGRRIKSPADAKLELPDKLSSSALFDAALAEGLLIAPGAMFSNSDRFDHYLRLNCGWPFTPEIEQGVRRLGQLAGQLAKALRPYRSSPQAR